MEQEKLSGWQKRKWFFLAWFATDMIGATLGNLSKGGRAFHFLEEELGIIEDLGNLFGFGLLGLAIGIVLAFIVRLFSKKIDFWVIVLSAGIIMNIISSLGLAVLIQQ